MKRTAALLLALLMSFACATAEEHPRCWVEYASYLPSWKADCKSMRLQGRVMYFDYSNVDPAMVENYLETLQQQGFDCVRSEGDCALYREGCIILLRDYRRGTYEIELWQSSRFHGQADSDDLIATVHDKKILCALDISPEGLFRGTGLQLFVCVCGSRSGETSGLSSALYLAGGRVCLQLDCVCVDMVCADLDQDGTAELVTVEWGPTSGIFTLAFKVYDSQNGAPHLRTGILETLDYGRFALIGENGKAYFEYERQYYDLETKTAKYEQTRFYEIVLDGEKIVFRRGGEEGLPLGGIRGN